MILPKEFTLTQNQSLKNPPNPPSHAGIQPEMGRLWPMPAFRQGVRCRVWQKQKIGDNVWERVEIDWKDTNL